MKLRCRDGRLPLNQFLSKIQFAKDTLINKFNFYFVVFESNVLGLFDIVVVIYKRKCNRWLADVVI